MAQVPAAKQPTKNDDYDPRRDVLSLGEGEESELAVLNEPEQRLAKTPIPAASAESASELDLEAEEDFPEDYPDYFPTDFADYLSSTSSTVLLKQREDTRGRLAIIYTVATFGMFLLGFVVAILDGLINQTSIADNLSKILPLLSGIFLGTLGFVLGYYFRQIEDENRSPAPISVNPPLSR